MSNCIYYGQIIVGPAGSGKSSYCNFFQQYDDMTYKRRIFVVNLDPAAEEFSYNCFYDVREIINVDDVIEELKLGPNGGLLYAMDYILENFSIVEEQLLTLSENDYVLFDCPGQIELYNHVDVIQKIIRKLVNIG